MSSTLDEVADAIIGKINYPKFPEDYLNTGEKLTEFQLPPGEEVMMYRELEGVFVMFDYERIFFKDPYEAKYVYYCAKKGMRTIQMPGTKGLKKLIRDFQTDLENLRFEIERESQNFDLTIADRKKIVEVCAQKLGYYDIMDI